MTKMGIFLSAAFLMLLTSAARAQYLRIDVKDANFKQVTWIILQEAHIAVVSSCADVKKRITVKSDHIRIDSLLAPFFEGQDVEYLPGDGRITIALREPAVPSTPREVRGIVQTEDNLPLSDVAVIDGEDTTYTNAEGWFHRPCAGDKLSLKFVRKGFETYEGLFGKQELQTVTLRRISANLDEVVIKGYGRTTRKLATVSVSGLSPLILEKQPLGNVLEALAGRIPGFVRQQVNGVPGSGYRYSLRGINSIEAGTAMLIVIDGVPIDNSLLGVPGFNSAQGAIGTNPLNGIEPSMIERVDVLKDAAATAIFGSRGANGVILIETKRARPGRWKIDVDNSIGGSRALKTGRMLTTPEYFEFRRDAAASDSIETDPGEFPDLHVFDSTRNNDYTDQVMGKTGLLQRTRLGLYGGTDRHSFLINLGHRLETAVLPGHTLDRRMHVVANWRYASKDQAFSVNIRERWSDQDLRLPAMDPTADRYLAPDAPPFRDAAGHLQWRYKDIGFFNIDAQALHGYTQRTVTGSHQLELSWQLPWHLRTRALLAYATRSTNEETRLPIGAQYPDSNAPPKGKIDRSSNTYRSQLGELTVDYRHRVGALGIEVLAGINAQQEQTTLSDLVIDGYTSDQQLGQGTGTADTRYWQSTIYYRYASLFSRLELNYGGRYLLTGSLRRDGSSRFGLGRQFGYFPAVAAGWIFTEARWMKRMKWLDFGKLRGSYGITGNDQIGDLQFLEKYHSNQTGAYPDGLLNFNLGWEKNEKTELALDLTMLRQRLSFSAAIFHNVSSNLLAYKYLSSQTGAGRIIDNQPVRVLNRGLELGLESLNLVRGKLRWSSALTMTFLHNELLRFPGLALSPYKNKLREGQPVDVLVGNVFAGVDPDSGLFRFRKVDNTIGQGSGDQLIKAPAGHLHPDFFGGLDNSLQLGRWGLSFFFEYRHQRGISPYAQVYQQLMPGASGPLMKSNIPAAMLGYWRRPGEERRFERLSTSRETEAGRAADAYVASDAYLIDASFLRWKDVSISYRLPVTRWGRRPLSGTALLRMENLATVTRFPVTDPETQLINVLPPLRSLQFELKLNF